MMHCKGSAYSGVFEQTLPGHSNMKKIAHTIEDKQAIGANRLYEYIDDEDVTRYFRREIFTRVCTDTSCMPIRLRLYWDVIGESLGYELPEGVELEKDEDNVFTKKDYEKLTEVLGDPVSILDTLRQ